MKTIDRQFWLVRTQHSATYERYDVVDFPANETVAATRAAQKAIEGFGAGDVERVDVAPLKLPDAWETFDVSMTVERRSVR